MKKNLLLATLSCFLLEAGRIIYSNSLDYIFLIWNLFLAAIPYLIASNIQSKQSKGYKLIWQSAVWLLFLPNSLYIITDLKHFRERSPVPEWFDCLLLFSFSTIALLFGLLSFYHMNQVLKKYVSKTVQHLVLIFISFISGFGVYLGREERWNSWDIVTNPFSLLSDCITLSSIPHVWLFSMCYGLSFLFMYYIISSLINFNHETSKQLV